MITIDARGKLCPMPVIMTKKAIQELTEKEQIKVIVDNKIAVENISKLAKSQSAQVSVNEVDGEFYLQLSLEGAQGLDPISVEKGTIEEGPIEKGTLLVLSSHLMGNGKDDLGKVLMKGFVFAVTQLDKLPEKVVLYNGGAQLTAQGSDSLEDFKYLESQGVEILTCGTCLSYYEIEDKLMVGEVTNMYTIVEAMSDAIKVIRP